MDAALDSDALFHAAVDARDVRFDGRFFTGVVTTGIYCRCVCPARAPLRKNRRFFVSAAAAEREGFRPCLVCRPELAPGVAPMDAKRRLAAQALQRIAAGALEDQGLEGLAAQLGVTSRHLRRATADVLGASPVELSQTHRLLAAKRLLADSSLTVTQVAFAAGFQSLRRFNALVRARYGLSPTQLRRGAGRPAQPWLSLQLASRGPARAGDVVAFLQSRALAGVETVEGGEYARTFAVGPHRGVLRLRAEPGGVRLTLAEGLVPALRTVVAWARAAFDLDADVEAIAAQLPPVCEGDPQAPLRVPGWLDAQEAAVRAVLGQQVTTAAGRTLAERLAQRFGEPLETGTPGLTRLFPSMARLADAKVDALATLGMPRSRAATVQRLAQAAAEGKLTLVRGALAAGRAGLAALDGIGPWTVEYVALRGLGDADAFPATDSALRAAARPGAPLEQQAERWRPWRAYAAVRLWRRHAAGLTKRRARGAVR